MVKLASALSRLNTAKVLIIGDLLLDMYTLGKARRISPEAPVAVIHVQKEEYRPGGAGNVALNLISLGAQVVMIGRVGNDWGGNTLKDLLARENIETSTILSQDHYRTPIKNRVMADNQQLVRIDYEEVTPLSKELEEEMIADLPRVLDQVDIVAISDYGKGFLTATLLAAIITQAKRLEIPVVTDPKGIDFQKYMGSTVVKPNLSEAYAATNSLPEAFLDEVACKLLKITAADMVMITRSEAGISLFETNGNRHDFPVQMKQVKDVTGAGDTVLAVLVYALANQLSYSEAAQLCNVAAGVAIEQSGCARVGLSDIAQRLLERDVSHKVFDEDHLFALLQTLRLRAFNLLMISNTEEMSQNLFKAIKQLAKENVSLLVYLIDHQASDGLIDILSSLKEVSFIVVAQDNLRELLSHLQPHKSYLFDRSILKPIKAPQQLLEESSVLVS